jgi:hypothetical protein
MKEVRDLTPLSIGAIASNAAFMVMIGSETRFSNTGDLQAFLIAGFGLIIAMLYALQLILMKMFYYRHHIISLSARVFLHICRIIQLLYTLMGVCLLAMTVYFSGRTPGYLRHWEFKFWIMMVTVLVTVVLNLTIFFKGWRLLKIVRTPLIDSILASFD